MEELQGTDSSAEMNFDLPPELSMLRETVRRFVDKEMIPIEREARDGHKLKPEVRAHFQARGREIGLEGYDVPKEYGGLGLGLLAKCVVLSELSRSIALPSRGADIFGSATSSTMSRSSASCCRPSRAK